MEYVVSVALILCCAVMATMFFSLKKAYDSKGRKIEEERNRTNASDYVRPLNSRLVLDSIRYNGIEPKLEEDGFIAFDWQDEHYSLSFGKLPVVQLAKTYNLEDVDFEAMEKAAEIVNDELVMVKVFVDRKDHDITFQIASVENSFGHLRASLPTYLKIMDNAVGRHSELFHKIVDGNPVQDIIPQSDEMSAIKCKQFVS